MTQHSLITFNKQKKNYEIVLQESLAFDLRTFSTKKNIRLFVQCVKETNMNYK